MPPTDRDVAKLPGLPRDLLAYGRESVGDQRVPLSIEAWAPLLEAHPELRADLGAEVEANDGIRRSFVHKRAASDPVELFLAAMAWGFGPKTYGPARVTKMMANPGFEANLAAIVEDTRARGAAGGWTSLLLTHRIRGLGMAYGTKLLYFAGYTSDCPGPRPLVLDKFVRAALVQFGAPIEAKGMVWRDDYANYLTLAEEWSSDESWDAEPEVVEFGLFDLGKRIARKKLNVDDDESEVASGEVRAD